jgi:hypothetical protein
MSASLSNTAVVLNGRLTASRARISPEVKQILIGLLKEATVTVQDTYFYRVDFGENVQPRHHTVSHDLYCTCGLEQDCAAVTAVKKHLKDGGQAAVTPEPGFYPVAPHVCPNCGGKVHPDVSLSSHHRGMGWRCEKGGSSCYWTAQVQALKALCQEKNSRPQAIEPVTYQNNPFKFSDGYDPNRVYPPEDCPLN